MSDPALSSPTHVSVVGGPLAAPVLRRVVGMIAARADLPVDRLDEALLLIDTIADEASQLALDGRVAVAIDGRDGTLTLELGPLREGSAPQLVSSAAVPGLGNVIERLSDELEVAPTDDGELLRLRLRSRD